MPWLLLILSLPTENTTVRMRAWRALKGAGAAQLRDGVYLLPDREPCPAVLESVAADVVAGGGTSHLLRAEQAPGVDYTALFDRNASYAQLLDEVNAARQVLGADTASELLKQTRKLRKALDAIAQTDYFPGGAQRQVDNALQELELALARALAPDEPHARSQAIQRMAIGDYKRRRWATRARPWVDRLACAWLIRRVIDPKAQFTWLKGNQRCPADAIGFDFDGATFSHVGERVSFEVMLASFGLEQGALKRIGALVHGLDVGGVLPIEAPGVESVLAGLRDSIADDDKLVAAAGSVFDALLATFEKSEVAT
jgi:hypothetical protein